MTHDTLITTLKNIILDEVMATPKTKKSSTSSHMNVGMAAMCESDEMRDGEEQRIAVQAAGSMGKSQRWNMWYKGTWTHVVEERAAGRRMEARKEERVTRKKAHVTASGVGTAVRWDILQRRARMKAID